jgi:hypothetical protein
VSTEQKTAWYGVRTLYRIGAEGTPKLRDQRYDPKSTLIEDRVVLSGAGSEVYSTTEVVRTSVSDSAIVSRRMGRRASEAEESRARYKFINGRILRKALALVASGKASTKT